jgi:hypothetical protein
MTVEVIVSVGLLAMLSVLSIDAIMRYRRAADEYFWRRAAIHAVDGQIQRYRAGAPWDSLPPAGVMPPQVELTTRREPGQGPWQGLSRVTVLAHVELPGPREIHEQMSVYLPTEVSR